MSEDRVLDAVLDVLAAHGVEKLSIRNVAHAAGISPAQVQYYYRSKRDLLRAGFDRAGEQFLASVAEAEPATVGELVHHWFPLDEQRERRARVRLAYAEMAARDEVLAAESARLDVELREWFVSAGLSDRRAAQLLAVIDGATVQCLVMPMDRRQDFLDRAVLPLVEGISTAADEVDVP